MDAAPALQGPSKRRRWWTCVLRITFLEALHTREARPTNPALPLRQSGSGALSGGRTERSSAGDLFRAPWRNGPTTFQVAGKVPSRNANWAGTSNNRRATIRARRPYRGEFAQRLTDNIAQPEAQGLGDSQKGVNRDCSFGSLHLADVNGMQSRLLGQRLLGHSALFAELADVLTDLLVRLKTGHGGLRKQVWRACSISGGLIKRIGLVLAWVLLLRR